MVLSILGVGKQINFMVKAFIYLLMGKDMMERLIMGIKLDKEPITITMEIFMKENGSKIEKKDGDYFNIKLLKKNMKETFYKEKEMGKVLIIMRLVICKFGIKIALIFLDIKDNGSMERRMGKEL